MKSLVRLFLVLFAITFTINLASANDSIEAAEQQVLPDLLSPDELAEEMGISALEGMQLPTFGPRVNLNARLQIKVDKSRQGTTPTAQTMQIYLDGILIHDILVSTGREKAEIAKSGRQYYSVTPTGNFGIIRRSKNHFSKTWQAPMPYAQFLVGGIAIHATTKDHYDELGSRASGGCVRVRHEDAKMIWDLVDEVGVDQVLVTISDNN